MKLLFGNKNYSSWSLRPWLVMRHFGISFKEELLLLNGEGWKQNLFEKTPSGFVPVLVDGSLVIDETIAIIEYLADKFPEYEIWPVNMEKRALARACSARMHSGFHALREAAPMNLRASLPNQVKLDDVIENIEELERLLLPHLKTFDGDFLFGDFCAADAMFAPIATRFKTYELPASKTLQRYFDAILSLPAFRDWQSEALLEPWVVDQDEVSSSPAQN